MHAHLVVSFVPFSETINTKENQVDATSFLLLREVQVHARHGVMRHLVNSSRVTGKSASVHISSAQSNTHELGAPTSNEPVHPATRDPDIQYG